MKITFVALLIISAPLAVVACLGECQGTTTGSTICECTDGSGRTCAGEIFIGGILEKDLNCAAAPLPANNPCVSISSTSVVVFTLSEANLIPLYSSVRGEMA